MQARIELLEQKKANCTITEEEQVELRQLVKERYRLREKEMMIKARLIKDSQQDWNRRKILEKKRAKRTITEQEQVELIKLIMKQDGQS
jgi:cell shape-determining protein MreC